jgi:hypothetical protein
VRGRSRLHVAQIRRDNFRRTRLLLLLSENPFEPWEAAMTDSKIQKTGDAQFNREISDDELEIVTAGRKAGEAQKEFLPVSDPPTPIETVIGWIRGLFS